MLGGPGVAHGPDVAQAWFNLYLGQRKHKYYGSYLIKFTFSLPASDSAKIGGKQLSI